MGSNPDLTTYQLGISFLICPRVNVSINSIVHSLTLDTKHEETISELSIHPTDMPCALANGQTLFEVLGIQQ